MLYFQPPSSEGEEGREEDEEIPSPHHVGSSSSSFMEAYPHFLTWQYDVMNPDGMYSSMPLTRPRTNCSLARFGMFLNVPFFVFISS